MVAGCRGRNRRSSAPASPFSVGIIISAGLLCAGAGCDPRLRPWWPQTPREAPRADKVPDADTGFTLLSLPPDSPAEPPARPLRLVELSVLHLRVPRAQHKKAVRLWDHLREDALDSDTMLRLRRNGFRVGVGHAEDWNAIKAVMDEADQTLVHRSDPIRLPELFPLDLELDLAAGDKTIFYIASDGILTGSDWADSRLFLRIAYRYDARYPDRVNLSVLPGVRRDNSKLHWVRTGAGMARVPRREGQGYTAVGFALTLQPDEFGVIGPGERAVTRGLIGNAFLTDEIDDVPYESYLFIRPARSDGKPRG